MIIKDSKVINKALDFFERLEQKRTGQRQWIDAGFYGAFDGWLKEEYNCVYNNKGILEFTDEKLYIVFVLRFV